MANNKLLEIAKEWKNYDSLLEGDINPEKEALLESYQNSKDVLLFSSEKGLFVLDKEGTVKRVMELESPALILCSHKGRVYSSRSSNIVDLFEDKVVYRRENQITSLASLNSELYSEEKTNPPKGHEVHEIYNLTQNKLIATREGDISGGGLYVHNNELYDVGVKEIFKTLENKVVAERDGRPWHLCSAKGVLYDYGSYHQVFDTLNNKLLISTSEDRWCEYFFSFGENLYMSYKNKVYNPFTKRTVFEIPEEIMTHIIHPREFFVKLGILK